MIALGMPPAQAVARLERTLGLSRESLAHALGTSPRTIERWKSGATYPQHAARQRLAAMIALEHRLLDAFDSPAAMRRWLHTDNLYLGGLSPIEVAQVGRIDRVVAALDALHAGIFI